MKSELNIEVRITEIDVMGHVSNRCYLDYLEWAREEWYAAADLTFDKFKELNCGTVVVNANINYRKECLYGDKLVVTTELLKTGKTSFVFKQEIYKIYNSNKVLVADAQITMVIIDLKTRKAVPLPDYIQKQFKDV